MYIFMFIPESGIGTIFSQVCKLLKSFSSVLFWKMWSFNALCESNQNVSPFGPHSVLLTVLKSFDNTC